VAHGQTFASAALANLNINLLPQTVAKLTGPFRVIELITVLVIAGIIIAITLPRCGNPPSNHLPAQRTSP